MDNADTQLERGDESICDPFRGTGADERIRRKLIYTDFLTPPIAISETSLLFRRTGLHQLIWNRHHVLKWLESHALSEPNRFVDSAAE